MFIGRYAVGFATGKLAPPHLGGIFRSVDEITDETTC
jgi:hypothetical protein